MEEEKNTSIFSPGRVCVKIAGREAGRHCAILEIIDENFVVIEGPEVRKRKCNILHLEPISEVVDTANAIQQISEKFNIKIHEKKEKQKKEKPQKQRITKKK